MMFHFSFIPFIDMYIINNKNVLLTATLRFQNGLKNTATKAGKHTSSLRNKMLPTHSLLPPMVPPPPKITMILVLTVPCAMHFFTLLLHTTVYLGTLFLLSGIKSCSHVFKEKPDIDEPSWSMALGSESKPLAEEDVHEALGEQWRRHYRFPRTVRHRQEELRHT